MEDTFDYTAEELRQTLLDQRMQVIMELKQLQLNKEYLMSKLSELNKELYGI